MINHRCPFCNQRPLRSLYSDKLMCQTGNCAIEGVQIQDEKWNIRKGTDGGKDRIKSQQRGLDEKSSN